MKIALIAPGVIPAQTANSIQVMKMAQAFVAEGHHLHVFAPEGGPPASWEELTAHYGLSQRFVISRLPARAGLRRYDYAWASVRAASAWGAELVFTRLPQAATLAARRGRATIFELHDLPSGFMGPWLLRTFLRARGAQRVVVNTQFLANQLRKEYAWPDDKEFLTVAPNGVDLQRYTQLPDAKAARKELRLAEGFTVGYSGHLYAGRGVGLILELARRLSEMRFLLVGGHPQDVAARQKQANGLPNVLFTGFVPNADLPLYQAACDVLLIPYNRQVAGSSGVDIAAYTNPLKMFEYLATGRPILASDLPILREILNEQNAVILTGGDEADWVAALLRLQGSPQERAALAKAAHQTATEYTWEKRVQRVLSGLPTSG